MTTGLVMAMVACLVLPWSALGESVPEVTVQKDIVYGRATDVDLKLDLAKPASGTGPFPALICIHGGGWEQGTKDAYEPIIRLFAGNGYMAAAVEYRFAPAHPWPAQIEDVKCAVRYLRAHAKELNIDPKKIGAVGDSAGGHLALMLALMDPKDGLEGRGGNPGQSSKVRAVVNLYGPTDLGAWKPLPEAEQALRQDYGTDGDGLLKDVFGSSDRAGKALASASPVSYINAGDPPVLTFHGNKDPLVPLDQANILHAALKKAGVPEKLVVVDGGGHGFGGDQFTQVLTEGTAFFDVHLKGMAAAAAAPAVAVQGGKNVEGKP